MIFDEGYIKYVINWENSPEIKDCDFAKLIICRNNLKSLNLIGVYPNGIGFGNVSCRVGISNEFIISGTQTADVNIADAGQFSLVYSVDIDQNLSLIHI